MNRSNLKERFSFLAWAQTLSMFGAVIWLLAADFFAAGDDFVAEETSLHVAD